MKTTIIRTKSRTKEFGKDILQFWSGGADSTYLLLQNILAGHSVTVTYVDITNNKEKVEREKRARKLLEKDVDKFCKYFNCKQVRWLQDHSITVHGEAFGVCPAPQQIIFAMFALLTGNQADEIHMGVVVGDSMVGSTLNEDFVHVYKKHFDFGHFPKVKYPLEDVSKEAIYLTLKGYDDLIGTHFLDHITVCEKTGKPCGDKKECKPCKTQDEVFKRLKWRE